MTPAHTAIAAALDAAGAPCLTCSFQAEDVVVLHMLREIRPDIPVLFLDTVHHFAETYAYRDELAAAWGLTLVNLRAAEPEPGLVADEHRRVLREAQGRSALRRARCARRLVHRAASRAVAVARRARRGRAVPASVGKDADEGEPARALDGRGRGGLREGARHSALLPLYDAGYTSIGCEPCTTKPIDPANPRSGRWQGQKLECGIHIQEKRL